MYKTLAYILLLSSVCFAQYNGKNFSLSLNVIYTTSAKIYLTPNSSDRSIRNNYFALSGIVNPGVDLRVRISENIILGAASEYMTEKQTGENLTVFTPGNQTETIDVEDGFRMIPFELSAYYLIPFSTDRFKFLMGGGAGYYYGEHIRTFGDAKVSMLSQKSAYGFHVVVGMDYLLRDNIAVRAEMKFRDPQFTVTSKYNKTEVRFEGRTVLIPQETFTSKINVDGVTFIAGLVFNF